MVWINKPKASDLMKKSIRSLGILCGLFALAFVFVHLTSNVRKSSELQVVGSKSNFLRLIDHHKKQSTTYGNSVREDALAPEQHSDTNTQVNGVDEEDLIKTDGRMIYQLNQGCLLITQAYPLEQAGLVQTVEYEQGFMPSGLYVNDSHVFVVGQYYPYYNQETATQLTEAVKVYVYDKVHFKEVKALSFEGYQLTTRMTDTHLMLIVQKYVPVYRHTLTDSDILPHYAVDNEEVTIDYKDIYYHDSIMPSTIATVFKVDLTHFTIDHYSYLGAVNHVYMNEQSIYLTNTIYPIRTLPMGIAEIAGVQEEDTLVTKIDHQQGFQAIATTKVKGRIHNQFMMDEYKGYFRITTTSGQTWDESSENNVYIFNRKLELTGKVEGLAKGESIQSTRFVGDRIYLVTFRMIDPFFVIDASDPRNPNVLGELKIPGFSTYLHPLDDNHVIGIGFEADNTGRTTGMKLALYDVTNPYEPKETFKEVIDYMSSGYGYSEVTYNHKALLYSKDHQLMAFPFTRSFYQNINENGNDSHQFVSLQEYKVYSIDSQRGFVEKATIRHAESDKLGGRHGSIDRGLIIGPYLYTVSNAFIEVHDLDHFNRVMKIDLPEAKQHPLYPTYYDSGVSKPTLIP